MIKTSKELEKELYGLDGKGYPAYKGLKGKYTFRGFELVVDHVQSDPFASPSRLYARVQRKDAEIPSELLDTRDKKKSCRGFFDTGF